MGGIVFFIVAVTLLLTADPLSSKHLGEFLMTLAASPAAVFGVWWLLRLNENKRKLSELVVKLADQEEPTE